MGDNIVYFNDKIVSNDENVFGRIIYSQNVLVRNGAKLLFTAQEEIEIAPPFTVEKNSEFEMRF